MKCPVCKKDMVGDAGQPGWLFFHCGKLGHHEVNVTITVSDYNKIITYR